MSPPHNAPTIINSGDLIPTRDYHTEVPVDPSLRTNPPSPPNRHIWGISSFSEAQGITRTYLSEDTMSDCFMQNPGGNVPKSQTHPASSFH
ncbi:unnamed protein product [Allacma fusca]|uniref:Uncharacterized protein n=1 Tax=Allacma fusca TaxID=39272 RepID=A0A8J2KMQ2_9HEXA|nr:unnamed protein product [Allacma fusca]